MKKCTKCGLDKPLNDFYHRKDKKGLSKPFAACKDCCGKKEKLYRVANKEKNAEYKRVYQIKNKKRLNEISNAYRENNLERRREYLKNYNERRRMLTKQRREQDPLYRATECLRNGVTRAFSMKGWGKTGKSAEILGADYNTVKKHIERQFKKGMSWDRRGEIHIDHIIPLSSAKTIDELKLLCHYTNLQPLWKIDNLKKNSIIPEVQLRIAI